MRIIIWTWPGIGAGLHNLSGRYNQPPGSTPAHDHPVQDRAAKRYGYVKRTCIHTYNLDILNLSNALLLDVVHVMESVGLANSNSNNSGFKKGKFPEPEETQRSSSNRPKHTYIHTYILTIFTKFSVLQCSFVGSSNRWVADIRVRWDRCIHTFIKLYLLSAYTHILHTYIHTYIHT